MHGGAATFGGIQISQITNVRFNGDSSPLVVLFPNCKGALIKPAQQTTRSISLDCVWLLSGQTKTYIEGLQHKLNEQAGKSHTATLIVNGNIFTNVFIEKTDFQNVILNDRLLYTIDFTLPPTGVFMDAQIDGAMVRPAYFNYSYLKQDTERVSFNFPIHNNFEAVANVDFSEKVFPRVLLIDGQEKEQVGGTEQIVAECFLLNSPIQHIERYLYNIVCGYGPLGKQGTLTLGTNVYQKAILTGISQQKIIGNTNNDGPASHVRFSLTWLVSLQC